MAISDVCCVAAATVDDADALAGWAVLAVCALAMARPMKTTNAAGVKARTGKDLSFIFQWYYRLWRHANGINRVLLLTDAGGLTKAKTGNLCHARSYSVLRQGAYAQPPYASAIDRSIHQPGFRHTGAMQPL